MSEAVSDVQQPSISHLAWVRVLQFLSGFAWLAAGVITAVDALDPGFPGAVTSFVLGAAITTSAVCVALWVGCRYEATTAANDKLILAELAALAAKTEQVSVKLSLMPAPAVVAGRLKQLVGRKLDESEYYQVYTDVLTDLCGLRPDEDPGTAATN